MIQSESAPSPSVGIEIVKTSELQVTEKASLAERRANALAGALNPTWVYFDIVRLTNRRNGRGSGSAGQCGERQEAN